MLRKHNGLSYRLYNSPWENIQECGFNLIFTSPPYNIGSSGCKKITNRKNGGYDAKSWGGIEGYADNLPETDYQDYQNDFLVWCGCRVTNNGVIAYNHKNRHKNGKFVVPSVWFTIRQKKGGIEQFDEIVWNRGSTHNHEQSYSYPIHEYVYLFRKYGIKHFFNRGRLDSVLNVAPARNNKHNAPMPIELAMSIISKFCPVGGIVCDPYSGSGTTMIAAYRCGCSFVGAEKEKKYYNLAKKRFERNGN